MSFWVYILRCADDSYYTGHTDNLEKRLAEHQSGICDGYTSARHPFTVHPSTGSGRTELNKLGI